jgi:Predicted transcriptional regulators
MSFPIAAALLDAMVLAIVCREDTYGYKITQDIRNAVDISESTLYPVLRRLQKGNYLETYDMEYMGRNRRYYKATPAGKTQLADYLNSWVDHKKSVDKIFLGGDK